MNYSYRNKKRKLYIVILVLTLVFISFSTTMAYFSLIKSQKEEGTKLYTGKLEINYLDGIYIRNPKLMPMTEPNYNTYNNVYRNDFIVNSSGTLNQTISIDLQITRNDFKDNTIRYIIFNSKGEKLGQGNIKHELGKYNLINNLYLAYNGQAKYTLMLWLNETGYNQNDEMGLSIYGKINIYSKQIKY